MNAIEEAQAELQKSREERDALGAKLAVARRDEHQAHEEMFSAADVDGQPFAVAFRRWQLAQAKIEVLASRVQGANDRVEDAQRTLARREAAAAVPPRVEKVRSGAEWEA